MMSDRPPMKNGMEWTVWKMWNAMRRKQDLSPRGWWRRGEVRVT